MQNPLPESNLQNVRETIFIIIEQQDFESLKRLLTDLHAVELSELLESMPPAERKILWEYIPSDFDAEILTEVHEDIRESLISDMDEDELVSAASEMDVEDLAEVIVDLPEQIREVIEESLDDAIKAKLETSLSFAEDTAGRIMSPDLVTVRADISLEVVLRYLKRKQHLPKYSDGLFVVDRQGVYLGKLSLEALLGNDEEKLVGDVMETDDERILATTNTHEIAQIFERYALTSMAVVEEGKLLGRINVEDVFEIIRMEADHVILSSAGLEDENLFSPVMRSAYKRTIWLAVNLATAFLAAWVIGLFEDVLSQLVALAVLMPVVASMGGIAGSQTLTLTIRGLALNQISSGNLFWLARKELVIGMMNGLLWAVVVAAIAWMWFGDSGIGIIIGAAIVINLIAAAAAGIAVPLLLHRFGVDPALSGAVILTTVTDVVGFMSFLGLATVFLLN
ncbi:MAG: magnesium transporter [Gammaproteobacteria bacterium]